MTGKSLHLAAVTAALALSLAVVGPASAQDGGGNPAQGGAVAQGAKAPAQGGPGGAQPAVPRIPATVLSGLLTGTPESMLALKQYLASFGANPEELSRQALAVVEQMRNSGIVRDPGLLIAAAERVTQAVRDTMSSAKIVQLKVDGNFRPPAGVRAFDFAPADARVREGFEKVLPTDNIVQGKEMQAVRRPGDDRDLLADGIVGVEKISVPMPNGQYRVTLMTESLGDATTSLSPFGDKIVANGKDFGVSQATPDAWLKQAVLSNQGLDGFQTATQRQGGAVTITVNVTGGKLDLGFNTAAGGEALKTYLTGMLVEPAAQASVFTTLPEVRSSLTTAPEVQTRYESQVASSIANLLQRAAPEAGRENDELARPVRPTAAASPS